MWSPNSGTYSALSWMARLSQKVTAAHASTVIAMEAATPGTARPRLRLRSRSANRIGNRDDLRPDTLSTNQGMADTAARYSTTMVTIMPIFRRTITSPVVPRRPYMTPPTPASRPIAAMTIANVGRRAGRAADSACLTPMRAS